MVVNKPQLESYIIAMASMSTETVALALRELAMSPADQDGLADFLTDYFGSSEPDELGKQ